MKEVHLHLQAASLNAFAMTKPGGAKAATKAVKAPKTNNGKGSKASRFEHPLPQSLAWLPFYKTHLWPLAQQRQCQRLMTTAAIALHTIAVF